MISKRINYSLSATIPLVTFVRPIASHPEIISVLDSLGGMILPTKNIDEKATCSPLKKGREVMEINYTTNPNIQSITITRILKEQEEDESLTSDISKTFYVGTDDSVDLFQKETTTCVLIGERKSKTKVQQQSY